MSQALQKDVPQTLRRWKRYPTYKDSRVEWLGEIPEHWLPMRIKYVTSILRGKFTHRPRNDPRLYDGDYPFIQTGDVAAADKYIKSYEQTLNELGFSVSKQFPKGTLVMAIAANIGDLAILDFPACFPDSIVGFLPKAGIDLNYLYFNLTAMKSELMGTAIQNTQLNLNVDRIGSLFSVCPPFSEQQAIASFLDRETAKIDALIAKKERLIELLQEKRTAIIGHVVTKGLDRTVPLKDSGVEWLGKIPAHWEVKRIRVITESIQTGPFGSQLHSEEYVSGGIPVINPSHLKDGRIEPDWDCAVDKQTWQRLSRHELREGDIIFARRGEMGRCALVTAAEAGWLCGTGSLRMRLKLDVAYPQFLNRILSTSGIRDWLLLESVGATMDNLNSTILARVPLSVPPIDEQVEIASYLDSETAKIDALIAKIREGIEKLKEYRTALISAAVIGKIDVRNEIAS